MKFWSRNNLDQIDWLTEILKVKQKLGVTFNSDKLGGIDFTKFLKIPDDLTASNIQWS